MLFIHNYVGSGNSNPTRKWYVRRYSSGGPKISLSAPKQPAALLNPA